MANSNPFFDVFISYGRADSKAFANRLDQALSQLNFNTWFDQSDIPLAVDFQEQINNGIEKTHNFIFIIAPHSVNSPYCLKEIELALKLNKRIIPLLHLEEITQEVWQQRNPNGTELEWFDYKKKGLHSSFINIHPTIGKINWIYFRENIDDFDSSLNGLVGAINKHSDYVQKHTQYLNFALEWQRNQRRNSYLLMEENRRHAMTWLKYKFIEEQAPCIPSNLHCEFICESVKQAHSFMTQAFLAYDNSITPESIQSNEIIQKIRQALMRNGLIISESRMNLHGEIEFDNNIRHVIQSADNFIYFVSQQSLENQYCQKQLQYALDCNKRVIFVVLEKLKALPTEVDPANIIDFSNIDNLDKYQFNLDTLINLLDQDKYYHDRHKYLLVQSSKWEELNHKSSILLRGYALQSYEDLLKISSQKNKYQFTALQKNFIAASLQDSSKIELEVFICYSKSDTDFARKLNENLESQGKVTFFDQNFVDPEGDCQSEIAKGIADSANFLFIISPYSVNSDTCHQQIEQAKKLRKRILTVQYRPTDSQLIHELVPDIPWIDFSGLDSDFYANFSQLIRLLDTDKDHVQSHTKWLQRTIEWEQKNKTKDLLLRGNELAIAQYWLKETVEQHKQPEATTAQQEFIQASITENKKSIMLQKLLFAAVSVGFVISTILGIVASRKSHEAAINELKALNKTSEALFSSNNQLDAFVEAIRAWKKINQLRLHKDEQPIKNEVERVIGQSVYQLKEFNRLYGHEAAVYAVDYSSDGKLIVSGSADQNIKLWEANGRFITTLGEIGSIKKGHTSSVRDVTFSPNNQLIASASDDETIKLWRRNQKGSYSFWKTIYGCGEEKEYCNGHGGSVTTIAFSPDNQMIASGSEDHMIKLWTTNGKYLATLGESNPAIQHTGTISKIVFSQDGQLLVSASRDKTLKVWQKNKFGNFTLVKTFAGCDENSSETCQGHREGINGLAITPDGKMIVSGSSDKTVKIWKIDGTLVKTLSGHLDEVEAIAINSAGTMIASVSRDKTIRLWGIDGSVMTTLYGHTGRIYDVVFKPHDTVLASSSRDNTIKLWRLHNNLVMPLYGNTSRVYDVAFSPDSQIIASAGKDKTIRLWNRQGKLLKTLLGHTAEIEKVLFSPNGQFLASASWDGTVRLWTKEGQLLHVLKGHHAEVFGIDFTPDNQSLVSLSADKTIKFWDLQGHLLQTYDVDDARVYDIEFSSDAKIMAIAIRNTVKIWSKDKDGYRIINTIGGCQVLATNCEGHTDDIEDIAISPDMTRIATGSRDKTVKIWTLDGKYIKTLRGHTSEIEGVNFSPDNQKIVSASRDGTLRIWEKLGQDEEAQSKILRGHSAEVYAAVFSPDGTTLASSSADQTVILWDLNVVLNLNKLIAYGCLWTEDYLKYSSSIQTPDQVDQNLCKDLAQENP